MASEDEDEEEPAGRLLRGEEQPREMPEEFSIGTLHAWNNGYAYLYRKEIIDRETVYVCYRQSDSGRHNECMVLRRESGVWIAYNSCITGNALICRNVTFRSNHDVTEAGYHFCEMNKSATQWQEIDEPVWGDGIWCLTKVITKVTKTEVSNEEIQ